MTPRTVENGWSDKAKFAVYIVERIGVTGALCCVILWGLYAIGKIAVNEIGVPMVQAHTKFLHQQVESMSRIVECQERQDQFWTIVQQQHTTIEEQIEQGNKQAIVNTTMIEQNQKFLRDATEMMESVPDERRAQTVLLQEIRDELKKGPNG
jgi:hypothetical protein